MGTIIHKWWIPDFMNFFLIHIRHKCFYKGTMTYNGNSSSQIFSDKCLMILRERLVRSRKLSAPSKENKCGLLKKWSYEVKSFFLYQNITYLLTYLILFLQDHPKNYFVSLIRPYIICRLFGSQTWA